MAAWAKLRWRGRRELSFFLVFSPKDNSAVGIVLSQVRESGPGAPQVRANAALANAFDCDGCCFAAADAERGDAAAEIALREGRKQRDENARAGCADGMAECAGAAVDVDLLVGKTEIAHGGHGDDGEGLVDFEQVDFREGPASAFE